MNSMLKSIFLYVMSTLMMWLWWNYIVVNEFGVPESENGLTFLFPVFLVFFIVELIKGKNWIDTVSWYTIIFGIIGLGMPMLFYVFCV